ncbi:porin family protein [Salisaeta longa]|uniref:porin family protein n=1 Tax=Salisaeta longa TaxID=503170 RepID=UPI0003B55CA7|nr:porin family protein [Salisaeta longa]
MGSLRRPAFWYAVVCILVVPQLSAAHGQSRTAPERRFGLVAGINAATLRTAPNPVGYRTAYLIGATMLQPLGGRFTLRPEVLFSQKGVAVASENGSVRYGAAYIELPLLLQVRGPRVAASRLHLMAGPTVSVKVNEQLSVGNADARFPLEADQSFYQRLDAGAVGGLGITLGPEPARIGLTLRYTLGLVDVAHAVRTQPFPDRPFPEDGAYGIWSVVATLQF